MKIRPIVISTAVAGTLDIVAAAGLALAAGRTVDGMLRGVASGPFPGASKWGLGGAALGLGVHFALMLVMVIGFVLVANRSTAMRRNPIAAGMAYGLVLWAIMNLVVLPLRWPALFPQLDFGTVATQIACHVFLVGVPIAFLATRD